MNLEQLLPVLRADTIEIPVFHMRGGTSTGLVIWKGTCPDQTSLTEELLRHLMGVPLTGEQKGNRQITGLGRGIPTSNKVFIVEHDAESNRLISTLAQLAADKSAIDWSVNCGNMSAALPLFAFDIGWLKRESNFAKAEIYNTNTDSTLDARLLLENGSLSSDTQIPGVHGCFPGVDLFLRNPAGAKTGSLFPTGNTTERICGIDVSCLDVAVPMIIAKANDFGKSGYESPEDLDSDIGFKDALRALWVESGLRMQLRKRNGDLMSADEIANSETIPKVCLVSKPKEGGDINARYFTPQKAHPSLAVSGGCCLASACLIEGTIANQVARAQPRLTSELAESEIAIENPAGSLDTVIKAHMSASGIYIKAAAYRRSAQILLKGNVPVYRPSSELLHALKTKVAQFGA